MTRAQRCDVISFPKREEKAHAPLRPCRPGRTPAEPRPIAEINTTPLIDVMLVLLIMIILTVPMPTHKVPIDLPRPGSGPSAAPPPIHRLDLDAQGRLFWDGAPIDDAALPARLAAMRRDPARPLLHMRTDAATRYARFDETLAAIKHAGVTRLGFVGNERFARFERAAGNQPW